MNDSSKKNKYFLGIDWGESRCGLSLADKENKIASGLEDINRSDLKNKIFDFNKKLPIKGVIIGEVNNKNFDQDVEKLKELGLEVFFENEKFSTLLAQRNLMQAGKKKISKNDNIESARIILQTWLDRQ